MRTRTTIIAAANSVFGRWDDTKKKDNVVNFVPSLLSRFDLKFIIRDKHNEESDIKMAKHVMDVHSGSLNSDSGTLHPELMRKYIDYCRKTCAPRITAEAGRKLSSQYVILRKNYKDRKCSDTLNGTECMGVRQLEGLIRLTEALAKMQLRAFADTTHAEEAIRLFRISMGESVDGIPANDDLHQKCEEKINRLIPLGAVMSHEVLIAHLELVRFTRKTAEAVAKNMTRQGKLQYRALKHEYFRLE